MKTLYLIRHSITEGNARRLYYGATDLPLTEEGHALCAQLRGSYDLPRDTIFATSGMLRAEQTLEGLFGEVDHEVYPDLAEMNQGIFERHSYDELKDTEEYQRWLSDTSGRYQIPGGESNLQFFGRTAGCARNLAHSSIDHMCIVCHGGTIASIMFQFFPEAKPSFYDWIVKSCHGVAIEIENGNPVAWHEI